ncbi:non-ribosomal peptide synthetase, partial [Streptomyces sp. 2MCAF27]
MGARVEADQECVSGVPTAGGFPVVPRWTREPVAGVAEYEVAVPGDVVEGVRELARELGVPVSAVLLAAHAKVLSALSGEQEVVTGYAADTTDPPLACRLTVASESWRTLVLSAHRATAEPEVADHEAGYEVEFDPAGTERGLGDGVVLGVGWCRCDRGGRLVARLRYRTEVIDGECAARIGGYH